MAPAPLIVSSTLLTLSVNNVKDELDPTMAKLLASAIMP